VEFLGTGERHIDDHFVTARTWRFARAWTGVATDLPDLYVGLTEFGVQGTEVDLVGASGADNHFDFVVPFSIEGLQRQVPLRPNPGVYETYRSNVRHPDHDRVVAIHGSYAG
jgi:hypothetical protein